MYLTILFQHDILHTKQLFEGKNQVKKINEINNII
jgi:hypothetical protein